MKGHRWDLLAAALLFTALGAAAGSFAARDRGPAAPSEDHGEAPPAGPPALRPETLRNLGVTVAPIAPGAFVATRDVAAVIERTARTEQPLFAPVAGRVAEVLGRPGTVVAAGATIIRLVREPIPRPTLALTEEILKPARESLHQAVIELRNTREEIGILETEIARVASFTGRAGGEELPILPRQTEIDLRYKLLRARRAAEQAKLELEKHGFTAEEIAAIAAGGPIPPIGEEAWRRALVANGLWTEAAEALYAIIPPAQRKERWTIATIGELAAAGLISAELLDWLRRVPDECRHFLEIGGLLQQGDSVAEIELLHDLGALDPVVELAAPERAGTPDWDVAAVRTATGATVARGEALATLLDPRHLQLRALPAGAELVAVIRAVQEGSRIDARPLVPDAGPRLTGLALAWLGAGGGADGTVAFAEVANEPLAAREAGDGDGPARRSWALREGIRYVLEVPTARMDEVFVLPAEAVVNDGPDSVVYIEDGDRFKAVPVEVAYRDGRSVVVPAGGRTRLFAGDRVVRSGAYALGLALRAADRAADVHAGHQH